MSDLKPCRLCAESNIVKDTVGGYICRNCHIQITATGAETDEMAWNRIMDEGRRAQPDLIPLPKEMPNDLRVILRTLIPATTANREALISAYWNDVRNVLSSHGQPRASQAMSVEDALVIRAMSTTIPSLYHEASQLLVKRRDAIERARAAKEG
ncbi:MAG: hypothetical protein KGL39_03810 [Patescibacteria group bacterium]|nr:hypothetical protein [Patescibacteria group bacterium]